MKNMTLGNIATACGGEFFGSQLDKYIEITGAQLDSRKIEPGNLFFATRGEKVDGHSFIPQVFEKGAACVICEEPPENYDTEDVSYATRKPYIIVKDSFDALKKVAAFYRKQLAIPVVGITGSVGKTSTKEAIAAILSVKYNVLKTAGNFNNEVGLPLTILSIMDHHEVAVVEMGISDFGEMDRLSEIARPDICVITNIGLCHLENLKTQEGILKAKTEMFAHRNPEGPIILNGDDSLLNTITEVDGTKPYRFGYGPDNDYIIRDVDMQGLFGSNFTIKEKDGQAMPCHSNLPGLHVVMNAACAALVGTVLGLSHGEIKQGIVAQESVLGRSNIIDRESFVVIDDCYNANPVSMKEAIDLLCLADGRKLAILGDMFELGEKEEEMHMEIGRYAAEKNVDLLITAGQLGKKIHEAAAASESETETKWYETKEDIIADLSNIIEKGDSVLIKASHGMHYENIVESLKSFMLS